MIQGIGFAALNTVKDFTVYWMFEEFTSGIIVIDKLNRVYKVHGLNLEGFNASMVGVYFGGKIVYVHH